MQEWLNGIPPEVTQLQWKQQVKTAIQARELQQRHRDMCNHYSLITDYVRTAQAACIGKGVAPYLDEIYNRDTLQIRIQVRAGSLMVRDNIGRHASPKWSEHKCQCQVCDLQVRETIQHFLLECPRYAQQRATLLDTLALRLDRDEDEHIQACGREIMMHIEGLTETQKLNFLLDGVQSAHMPHVRASVKVKRAVSVKVEKTVNKHLWLCWQARQKHIDMLKTQRQQQSQMHFDNSVGVDLYGVSDMFVHTWGYR